MIATQLRLAHAAPGDRASAEERLRDAIRSAFAQDVHVPAPADVALYGRSCTVANCEGWDAHSTPRLCSVHRHRLRCQKVRLTNSNGPQHRNDIDRVEWAKDLMLNGGPVEANHPGYDFTGLPPRLEQELRLLVETRSDHARTYLRRHDFQAIRKVALQAGLVSLIPAELSP